ncbi:DUF2842 domain-containing protein [Aurantiacibacter hainanensis]|uniref:DUF2842 domain-containing protein n=1 Tax=Aurantiacibacter hainanensis TaxID=3076114 RepID=UPI0030C7218D
MRTEPTWRIPVGILALLAGLGIYALLVALVAPPLIGDWPTGAQTLVYIVLGVIWVRPLRRFLIWMETGRWG